MRTEIIVISGDAKCWEDIIALTSNELLKRDCVTTEFYEKCVERENQFPTGLETLLPVAIPHTDAEYVIKSAICIVRLDNAVEFNNMEDSSKKVAVKYVMNLALCKDKSQVELLKRIISIFQDEDLIIAIQEMSLSELSAFLDYRLTGIGI